MSIRFHFRAARSDGGIAAGTIEAATEASALSLLRQRGVHPIRLTVADGAARAAAASRRDLAVLFQSLDALISAGVPLERALKASEAVAAARLRQLIPSVLEALRQGESLSMALSRGEGLIPASILVTLRAGEAGSQLPATLHQLSIRLQSEAELLARLRQALAYPMVLLLAGLCSVALITLGVLPRFATLLADVGQTLPPATRALLAISGWGQRFGLPVLLCVMALATGGILATRDGRGRVWLHQVLISMPVVGPIRHGLATARITNALAGMFQSGLPLLTALKEAGLAGDDAAIGLRMTEVREMVSRGEPFALSAGHRRALSPMAVQLLHVGEQSGQLAEMASHASALAATETERALRLATGLLEPALVIGLGGLVAFVAAALLQAVYSLRPG